MNIWMNNVCKVCNTSHFSEDIARRCEEAGKRMKEWERTLKPYMWYHLYSGYTRKEIFVFAIKVKFDYHASSSAYCLNRTVSIFSSLHPADSYYSLEPAADNLIGVYTIEDAYEKFGIVPRVVRGYMDEIPEEVKSRIKDVYSKKNHKILSELESMSREELIDKLYYIFEFDIMDTESGYDKDISNIEIR